MLIRKVKRRTPSTSDRNTLRLPEDVCKALLKCNEVLDAVKDSVVQLRTASSKKG